MRHLVLLPLVLAGCIGHAEAEESVQTVESVAVVEAEVDPEAAQLDAACRAVGPALTNLLLQKAPAAQARVDAIAHRITQGCLERGDLREAECMMKATDLRDTRRCAPDWALPWLGVPGCDAYMHDVVCMVDHLPHPDPDVSDALYQTFDAWFSISLEDVPAGTLNMACETAVDAVMEQPFGGDCLRGRASHAATD